MSPETSGTRRHNILGEDVVPVPRPLPDRAQPPVDRYCDLVLTGGVASGVVYPWAVLELARHYRFRSIGGTSVGAIAAALAAAAEYGRSQGHRHAFEVLRRAPGKLAELQPDGATKLLSLFEAAPAGKRLLSLFVHAVRRADENKGRPTEDANDFRAMTGSRGTSPGWNRVAGFAARLYAARPARWAAAALVPLWWLCSRAGDNAWALFLLAYLVAIAAVVGVAVWQLLRDLREGLIGNNLGLCDGKALVHWLHENIQRAAGLAPADRPLTFRELWRAPARPGAGPTEVDEHTAPELRAIDLQMFTSNVTLGRPVRLPLSQQGGARLYFDPEELAAYLPEPVLTAMVAGAEQVQMPDQPGRRFHAVHEADLPIVVAARLSLSFPLLFSAVPLYARDEECPDAVKPLERCWFSDGGLCSNFPVHLFDAAVPRWPTFGMWLGDRSRYQVARPWYLPRDPSAPPEEMRRRFDPTDSGRWQPKRPVPPGEHLTGFLWALAMTAKDWGDYSRMRMPHVRDRVARMALYAGEGGLNIAMSRQTLLEMAHAYGTAAGKLFVERYGTQADAQPGRQWREQRWVRLQVLIEGLREFLRDIPGGLGEQAHTVPLDRLLREARDLTGHARNHEGPTSVAQARSYQRLLRILAVLDRRLDGAPTYRSDPPVELRLRPSL